MTTPSKTLEEAIKKGMEVSGWPFGEGQSEEDEQIIQAIATAVNDMDGRASNEGEKQERRKVAVGAISEMFPETEHLLGLDEDDKAKLDAIIAEAQG